MVWFRAFRQFEVFTRYPSNRSAVTVDKDFVAVIYVCVLVFLASILTAFGSRGKERRTTVIRVAYSVIVCSIILLCLYGHGWQEGDVTAKTMYLFRSTEKIEATIGIRMSLDSVNITLSGQYGNSKEGIDYNERLSWLDVGELESEFHKKLVQGLPAPLITIAEYVSVDIGGFRWGRYFREASYYSFILLWASFAFWVVTIILMCSVVFFGSIMFIISGLTMCITVLVYHLLQPIYPFMVPFDKQILHLHYSWCFWLLVATGIITTILGIVILVFNYIKPKETANFFGLENEFPDEADDISYNMKNALDANKAADCPFPPYCYSNPCFNVSHDTELLKSKESSLPELNADTNGVNTAGNDSHYISSLDRSFFRPGLVSSNIPVDVGVFSDKSFRLPKEEQSKTGCEKVPTSEENKADLSTRF